MEYVCFAVDIGSNMGPRNCSNLRELDKTASHLDLALYSLLSMVNKKERAEELPAWRVPLAPPPALTRPSPCR